MKENGAVKISVTLRSDLLDRVDSYADENGMTRSGLLAIAATQFLNAQEAMPSVNRMLAAMAAVADGVLKGEMTPTEANARMEAINSTYEQLTKK